MVPIKDRTDRIDAIEVLDVVERFDRIELGFSVWDEDEGI